MALTIRTLFRLPVRGTQGCEEQRNRLIRERRAAGGKKAWKWKSGYHRRSLVETHMFRQKVILGQELHNRAIITQKTEARIRAHIQKAAKLQHDAVSNPSEVPDLFCATKPSSLVNS